ncbi:Ribonuclease H superfamily [Sesbania bispinosa]|nr:Ribonuclease H superfamily [Sesbania bispinosa]
MSPPIAGTSLRLYLAISHNAINGLIAQEIEGEERPISYLSRMMKDVETRYSTQEKFCLGVVYAAQKYKQYFQAHIVQIISKSEGIKFMLSNGAINGRVSRWALLLSEHDIQVLQPQKLGCQALADMIALCPGQPEEEVMEEIRGEVPEEVQMSHVPRAENKHADALATIGSKEAGTKSQGIVTFQNIAEPSLSLVSYEVERNGRRGEGEMLTPSNMRSRRTKPLQKNAAGEAPKEWADYLPLALWAYRTTKHGSTKATPFSLVFGAEATLPAEILVPSARMKLGGEQRCHETAEVIEEIRDKAEEELIRHHRRLTLAYEKMVRPRMFHEGEMVSKATDAVMRKQHVSKWAPNWERPYIVQEAQSSGCCTLIDPEDQRVIGPINFKYVKKYYT